MQGLKYKIADWVYRNIGRINGGELVGLMFLGVVAVVFIVVCALLGAWLGWRAATVAVIAFWLGLWLRGKTG